MAVIKGWVGDNKPAGHSGTMHSGEDFSGPLELGAATIHDDSNGFNLAINVIYAVGTYAPAKARADADCPPPRQSIAPAHARPKQSAKP
ncbi:MAG: hypothetical protein ABI231_10985 [Candidatus Tumulicola sp.]